MGIRKLVVFDLSIHCGWLRPPDPTSFCRKLRVAIFHVKGEWRSPVGKDDRRGRLRREGRRMEQRDSHKQSTCLSCSGLLNGTVQCHWHGFKVKCTKRTHENFAGTSNSGLETAINRLGSKPAVSLCNSISRKVHAHTRVYKG